MNTEHSEQISIGQILRQKRLEQGLEISEISKQLKVKHSDIEAIESNDIEGVRKHLYLLGLLYSYGEIVGVSKRTIKERTKLLPVKIDKVKVKAKLVSDFSDKELSPNGEMALNFLLIFILVFIATLLIKNSYQSPKNLITNERLIEQMKQLP